VVISAVYGNIQGKGKREKGKVGEKIQTTEDTERHGEQPIPNA
jgi:hypothetical protein